MTRMKKQAALELSFQNFAETSQICAILLAAEAKRQFEEYGIPSKRVLTALAKTKVILVNRMDPKQHRVVDCSFRTHPIRPLLSPTKKKSVVCKF